MKKSYFTKELKATGTQGVINATVIATMNYNTASKVVHNPSSHEDENKLVSYHKVEGSIEGLTWKVVDEIPNDNILLVESERMIKDLQIYINHRANDVPIKTFGEKMMELFK